MSGIRVIKVPDVGEGIAEVELVAWHVQPGDSVAEDQALADVMTDKASVEIPSPVAGVVQALGGDVGQMLAVGAALIRIEVEGAASAPTAGPAAETATASPSASTPASAPSKAAAPAASSAATSTEASAEASAKARPSAKASAPGPSPAPARAAAPAPTVTARAATPGAAAQPAPAPSARPTAADRPIASPALRRRAWEAGVDLHDLTPTGSAGRIVQADLDAYVAAHGDRSVARTAPPAAGVERHDEAAVRVIGLRRRIALQMQESKRRIPHFSYVEELDVTELEALRAAMNAKWRSERGHLTLLPLLMRAMVLAVAECPQVNARFDDEAGVVTRHGAVHLGVATQTHQGLMVPVLRHAEARGVWDLAAETARLAEAARSGRATRAELSGSTITISSLGAQGGIVSTPVINRPEVAIVAVNRIVEKPVVRGGQVVVRQTMNLSSSFDHRVVDGADAAQFVQAVRARLEVPGLLFAT